MKHYHIWVGEYRLDLQNFGCYPEARFNYFD
ncbi:hypothetical protein Halru_0049 [Halovivax ruber XH-70]|uniref:Uncharacterized protein n=1 Tax=Halovivax ruber (strain DSM 18193 / JCM 13892 / XH-70) TaxID=797302 RepID=L0I7E1_HALRX|nr:hypothetical protein Halru_0049 [Halovivax ruber XH-70]